MAQIALVTGANQGLGFALVEALAARLNPQDVIYLTARSDDRGRAAVEAIGDTRATVRFARLDVSDLDSVDAVADMLQTEHGGVDIVASNAAARISKDVPQADQARQFVATNNHGSHDLYQALAPLLAPNSRYVFVASSFGQLRNLPPNLHPLFDTDKLSLDDIEGHMDLYVTAVEQGTASDDGWPEWINIPSKIGQVATARIAARDTAVDRPDDGILINAVCPGLLDTDASRPWFDDLSGAMPPAEAAGPIVDLLLAPPGTTRPNGQLVQFGNILPWHEPTKGTQR